MRTAAIFEIDGTLIPYMSAERIMINYLIEKRIFSIVQAAYFVINFFKNIGKIEKMIYRNKYYYRGLYLDELRSLARQCFLPRLDQLISVDMQHCISYHRKKGDMIILISASPSFIVEVFATALSFDEWRGTELECINGILSGAVSFYAYGKAKLTILKELRTRFGFNLSKCFAYANNYSDLFLLKCVGRPVVVNPDKELQRIALLNGWIGISEYETETWDRFFL